MQYLQNGKECDMIMQIGGGKDMKGKLSTVWNAACTVGKWTFTLRSLILAIPVAAAAVFLAVRNSIALPAAVSFDIANIQQGRLIFQTVTIGRSLAVIVPLIVTLICLVLTCCSKRVVYPWLISIFSLLLPIVLLLVNSFP